MLIEQAEQAGLLEVIAVRDRGRDSASARVQNKQQL
jgi:hypothetical protein